MVNSMVNQLLVERILSDINSNIHALRNADDITWDVYKSDLRSRRFVERSLHIMVEAVIDVAQHVVSDENLREPSSYRDTFLVLAENGIINTEHLNIYEKMAAFRHLIVHYYERIDDEVVFGIFKKNLKDFELFITEIVQFMEKNGVRLD
jgi:uncharacterized protein YutE (UPF0331/DUF86 family)